MTLLGNAWQFFVPNFVHLFSTVLSIIVLFLSEITWRIRNWHNAERLVRILQLAYTSLLWCYVQNNAKFTEKVEAELRKIDK